MKRLEEHELKEHLSEILRLVQKGGEIVEITDNDEVLARLVPAPQPLQPAKRDLSTFWKEIDQLAAEIGAHWKGDFDAVEAVRDVRRDL